MSARRSAESTGVEHRRFLARPEAHRPFARSAIFERAGGRVAVDALIEGLYARIERDPALRPLFGRDLTNERAAQKRFFTEWLGGEPAYTEYAWAPLAHRHDLLPITSALTSGGSGISPARSKRPCPTSRRERSSTRTCSPSRGRW